MKVLHLIDNDQLVRIIKLCYRAQLMAMADAKAREKDTFCRIPVCIVGDPGCGKTAGVLSFHREMHTINANFGLWMLRLGLLAPEDVGGYPQVKDGEMEFAMLNNLPWNDEHGIVFLDELGRCAEATQNASLPIVGGDMFHGHQISRNAFVIAAMNGESDTYETPLSRAYRSRMCTVFMSSATDASKARWKEWADGADVEKSVIEFHQTVCKQSAMTDFDELAICNNRTLEMMSWVLKAKNVTDDAHLYQTDDIIDPILEGLIGIEQASMYRMSSELQDLKPEQVLAGCATIPDKHSKLQYLGMAVKGLLKSTTVNDGIVNNLISFMRKMPKSWQIVWREMFSDVNISCYPWIQYGDELRR
jgi:hypothetical protein